MIKWLVIIHWFHEFSDPQGATMVGAERRNFTNFTCSGHSKSLSQTPSNIFLSSTAAANWWLWIWLHGIMCTKNISVPVAFKVLFFAARIEIFMSAMQLKPCLKQLNRAHALSYHQTVNLQRLDSCRCSAEKKLKI